LIPAAKAAGCASGFVGNFNCAAPYTHIQNMPDFGFNWANYDRYWGVWPVDVDVSYLKGKHNLKFGAQFIQMHNSLNTSTSSAGTYNFLTQESGLPGFLTTGLGYASYLMGLADSGSLVSPVANSYEGQYWALFAQDQWRVTPKLTVNYGLRWDYNVPLHE